MGKQNKETELECAIKLANEYVSRLAVEHAEIDRVKKLLLDSAKPFDELRQLVAELGEEELPDNVQKTLHKILRLHAASAMPYDAACALLEKIDTSYTTKTVDIEKAA